MTSEIHLKSLWNIKQEELDKDMIQFIIKWNEEHKCLCCKNWKKGQEEIECEHLEKEIEKIFGKKVNNQYKNLVLIKSISFNRFFNN